MIEFQWWWMVFALPLPILVRLIPTKKVEQSASLNVGAMMPHLPSSSEPEMSSSMFKKLLMSLAWICLILASMRPQWLGEPISIPTKGRDLMVAVDLSGSMQAEDMNVNGRQVNRLQMIKHVLANFIERRVGDRLGLILFADTAYLQAPLTYDRQTVGKLLNESVIGLVGDSTAIGDAIGLAVKRFQSKEETNKVLILLTDGQNTAGNITPEDALKIAQSEEVTIYTIGVGADSMVQNSFLFSRRINPSADLDEQTLTNIAEATGGRYFRARDTQELENIYATLDKLEPIERDTRQMRPLSALYFYPLSMALFLVTIIFLPHIYNGMRTRLIEKEV